MASEQVDWNANEAFYQHIKFEVWDKISQFWETVADATSDEVRLNGLEKIHLKLIHWNNFLRYYLDQSEIEEIEGKFKEIDDITQEVEFSRCYLEPQQWTAVRQLLHFLFARLANLSAKYGMLPNKIRNKYELPAAQRY